ncbi:transcription antitermination factor NusB [Actinomyces sp. F1_1611]
MSKPYRAKRPADPARLLAVRVLLQVEEEGAFANLALPRALRAEQQSNPKFDFRDAAFASELVYGTLRWRGYLDQVLDQFSSRPLTELEPVVWQLLRVGAYQLLFMRVPDHAAVAATVDAARELTTDGPVRMVNAILRSITRADDIDQIFAEIPDQDDRLAARYSHPVWMVRSFRRALEARGLPESELVPALAANNSIPKVNLVARPGLIAAQELAQEAEEILQRPTSQGQLSEYAVILDGGDPAALPAVREGRAAVQDEGSQLAALLLAAAPLTGSDRHWLDLCAGPGGKSALLGAVGAERGVDLVANEISAHRARLVEKSVRALANVTVTNLDGRTLPAPSGYRYDRVLIDAPCSGLGSLRRRPESRWRHQPEELAELVPLQRGLLQRGWELTRTGGVIAWVTCTPQVEETLEIVSWALEQGQVETIDTAATARTLTPIELEPGPNQTLQLWPHRHGTDAMFVALLRKK